MYLMNVCILIISGLQYMQSSCGIGYPVQLFSLYPVCVMCCLTNTPRMMMVLAMLVAVMFQEW